MYVRTYVRMYIVFTSIRTYVRNMLCVCGKCQHLLPRGHPHMQTNLALSNAISNYEVVIQELLCKFVRA